MSLDDLPPAPTTPPSHERVRLALEMAMHYGGFQGDHHRAWAIDQMVRLLTGCAYPGETLDEYLDQAHKGRTPSVLYSEWVAARKRGEDGPDTYEWDEGIPP